MSDSLLLEHSINEQSKEVYLSGEVNVGMYHRARIAVEYFKEQPFTVVLNTEGGDVYHALAIYEILLPANASVHCIGSCQSCGIDILQAGKKRTASLMTTLMVHFGEETNESGSEAKNNAHLNKLRKQILHTRTGRSMRAINKWMDADTYFTAEEAVKAGLLDGIA